MGRQRIEEMTSLEEQVRDIQDRLKGSEYPNKQAISQEIVLPLLRKMGWPDDDTRLVTPQYTVKGGTVDFALCAKRDKPHIFIEVKQSDKTTGADEQLFSYAFHEGVQFAILTDGKEWRFYLPAEKGRYEERKVYKLDLVEHDVNESSDRLLRYLSFEEVKSGRVLKNAQQDYKNLQIQEQAKNSITDA